MSRITRASVEPPSGLKKKKKGKKGKISGSNAEIFEVSRKKSAAAEMSNR
jgi:ribosome assembly protein YihI (activator of Der GTPase)